MEEGEGEGLGGGGGGRGEGWAGEVVVGKTLFSDSSTRLVTCVNHLQQRLNSLLAQIVIDCSILKSWSSAVQRSNCAVSMVGSLITADWRSLDQLLIRTLIA